MPQHTHPPRVSFPRKKKFLTKKDGITAIRRGVGGVCAANLVPSRFVSKTNACHSRNDEYISEHNHSKEI
jgi:hypothetical protein